MTIKEMVIEKDISFLTFTLSLFLLPLSISFSTFTLITAIGLKLIQVSLKRGRLFESVALKHSAIIGFLFFIFIQLNSIFQVGLENHLFHFKKLYAHFALFFIVPILLRGKKQNKFLLEAFFLGIIAAVIITLLYAIFFDVFFDKYAFAKALDIHHTYLSMYILTIANFSVVEIITNKSIKKVSVKVLFICLGIVFLFIMYFLNSKVGMLIFLILYIVHSLPELSKKNAWHYIIFLVIILTVLSFFINKVSVNYERALDFRLQIWEVSFAEFEANPIFGNLNLPEKDILNYHHYVNGKYYFLDSDLNSHNQYLSVLMRFGLFGFFILSLYLINIFRKINQRTKKIDLREVLGFFIILFTICYIENILDRHHGIVYFSVFYNYYLVKVENARH